MIDLKTTKTYIVADNNTIKPILSNAFKQAVDEFVTIESQHTKISKKEHSDLTLILIDCQKPTQPRSLPISIGRGIGE